jgi:hypothetical protein
MAWASELQNSVVKLSCLREITWGKTHPIITVSIFLPFVKSEVLQPESSQFNRKQVPRFCKPFGNRYKLTSWIRIAEWHYKIHTKAYYADASKECEWPNAVATRAGHGSLKVCIDVLTRPLPRLTIPRFSCHDQNPEGEQFITGEKFTNAKNTWKQEKFKTPSPWCHFILLNWA